jgi:hypothetical protein
MKISSLLWVEMLVVWVSGKKLMLYLLMGGL